jgi:FkbM family methyltransferase
MYPLVVQDSYGVRTIYYPWETTPLPEFISRDFYKPEIEAAKRLISPGDTVFDVGANIGLFSAIYSKFVTDKGKVYAFEPIPETHWMLLETLALNKTENVSAQRLALSEKKGRSLMHTFDKEYSAWSSFGRPQFGDHKPSGTVKVRVDTIDNYCSENNIKKINFLKLDVEGYEKHVLKGAEGLLRSGSVDVLSFEISKIPLEASGVKPNEVFTMLRSFGYKAYSFDIESLKFKGPVEDSDAFYENYYASKKDLRQR